VIVNLLTNAINTFPEALRPWCLPTDPCPIVTIITTQPIYLLFNLFQILPANRRAGKALTSLWVSGLSTRSRPTGKCHNRSDGPELEKLSLTSARIAQHTSLMWVCMSS
jgi:hypothetical protein